MKSLFIIVATLMVASSWAQTDALNLEKYWKFRNEFVEKFVKIENVLHPIAALKRV